MLAILMLLTEVITSTISGSYRYPMMGYDKLPGMELDTSNRVVIAVIDSGISANSLSGLYERVTLKQDTTGNKVDRQGTEYGTNHADKVLLTMVDDSDIRQGTCFLISCHSYLYKALWSTDDKPNGTSTTHSVSLALILACADPDVDIVNLSLSTDTINSPTEYSVRYCVFQDKLLVTSAGNDGFIGRVGFPCHHPQTLCVGSVDRNGRRYYKSNLGSQVDVYAPGLAFYLNDDRVVTGTSYATALVSGMAALVLSQNKGLTSTELREIIVNGAQPSKFGLKVVNVYESLKLGDNYGNNNRAGK